MYVPGHFEQPRVDVMHDLIRARPLGTMVTLSAGGLNANHIPFQLLESPAPFGTLRGHVARANPILDGLGKDVENRDAKSRDVECLIIFHGPQAYISPSWYVTKQESGKVVPTWNYAVVHAYGKLQIVKDPDWLRAQIEALTTQNEAAFPEPWKVSDAPREYIERMLGAIVGVEIVITRLIGKWKASQNQPAGNQAGVIAGLNAAGSSDADAMAALVAAAANRHR